ncbi:hypothetical protein HMPREF2531_00376 [Bacteroides intestinalis]|uniref:Uncharacterized protein n=1 Tax=Bacteroides intestinalis TaxID=329854 RepID=A0A139LUB9_9BACE|nr:hypothetical protein HMPREF2531_00376 [Bacteroides intestinalis]
MTDSCAVEVNIPNCWYAYKKSTALHLHRQDSTNHKYKYN